MRLGVYGGTQLVHSAPAISPTARRLVPCGLWVVVYGSQVPWPVACFEGVASGCCSGGCWSPHRQCFLRVVSH